MCPGWIWFLLVFFPPAQLWEGFWRKDLELMWLSQSLELHSWAQHHPKGSQCSLKPWPGISSWICTKNGEKGGFFWHFGKVRLNRKMLPPRKNCFLKLLLNNHHTNPAQAELSPWISSSWAGLGTHKDHKIQLHDALKGSYLISANWKPSSAEHSPYLAISTRKKHPLGSRKNILVARGRWAERWGEQRTSQRQISIFGGGIRGISCTPRARGGGAGNPS